MWTDVDGDSTGALEQRLRGAGHDEAAGVDHDDVIAHVLHVVEQVRGHQHGDAEGPEAADEGEHLLPPERVETRRGLVEQHELRIADQGLGQLRPLAHAGREPADRPEPRFVQPDEIEDVGCPLAGGARGSPLSSPNVDTTSAAVWSSGRQSCSGMNPSRERTWIGSVATSTPATSMRPAVG